MTVIWRRILDDQSVEHATFMHSAAGRRIAGHVRAVEEGTPLRVEYDVDCDAAWRTVACAVRQDFRGNRRKLFLRAEDGQWLINGTHDKALDGCIDIDLGISPSTNTLPIDRAQLKVGESRSFKMAWLKFPELTIVPDGQSYERLSECQYRYRSLSSDFTALLDVDEHGIVEQYEHIWSRVRTGNVSG